MKRVLAFLVLALAASALLAGACSDMPLLDELIDDVRDNPSDPDGEAYEPSWKAVGGDAVEAGAGSSVSLAIGDGVPYVAFAQSTKVRVRKLDGDAWTAVGSADIDGVMTVTELDLAVRGAVPYVVLKPNSYEPECKYLSGTAWATVGTSSFAPTVTGTSDHSIVLTDTYAFIAFKNASTNQGLVARFDGTNWDSQVFFTNDPKAIGFAFHNGKPFASFVNGEAMDAVSVRTTSTSAWHPAGWDFLYDGGVSYFTGAYREATSIAFSGDVPYVASMQTGTVSVARNSAANVWADAGANPVASNGFLPRLAAGPDGTMYIAYKDNDHGAKLTVKRLVGSTWETVGQAGFSGKVGDSLDLAVSPVDGKPYVAYVNADDSNKVQVMAFE